MTYEAEAEKSIKRCAKNTPEKPKNVQKDVFLLNLLQMNWN